MSHAAFIDSRHTNQCYAWYISWLPLKLQDTIQGFYHKRADSMFTIWFGPFVVLGAGQLFVTLMHRLFSFFFF